MSRGADALTYIKGNNTMNKLFVCKSKRLAGFLVSHGCECVKVDTDKLNPKYSVYLFEKTELWNTVMKEWSKEK